MTSATLFGTGTDEKALRAQRLAAAKIKLKAFRASRSPAQSRLPLTSATPPKAKPPHPSSSPAAPLPLTNSTGDNCMSRLGKRSSMEKTKVEATLASPKSQRVRHSGSKGSAGGHRRQQSSMTAPSIHKPARTSVVISFDPVEVPYGSGAVKDDAIEHKSSFGLDAPSEIITTPATPIMDTSGAFGSLSMGDERPEDLTAVKAKLSAFNFGAKSPIRSISPNALYRLPSTNLLPSDFAFPPISPSHSPCASSFSAPSGLQRLSTPSSRPPSLLLTRPTPLSFSTPSAPGSSRNPASSTPGTPSTPPTLAQRRHSHTRSESISLPNLTLGRPTSLGIPSSPSYSSSPCSSASSGEGPPKCRSSGSINGTRLKFEPSGRGAEAEKEKNEYHRKALEKLTGGGRSPPRDDNPSAEISLPDLDDEDRSSTSSSVRPLSGAFSFSQSSVLSLPPSSSVSSSSSPNILSASPFTWASPAEDESSPIERWSGFGIKLDETKEDGLGFGVDLAMMMPKRPSLTRNLSVLAEVDEDEDQEEKLESSQDDDLIEQFTRVQESEQSATDSAPITAPTPSRLRELQLHASVAGTPSRQAEASPFTFPRPATIASPGHLATSPRKDYDQVGRGRPRLGPRPRPLSGIPGNVFAVETSSSPSTDTITAPQSVKRGARGSSILYKKDGESSQSGSSRDWTEGSKSLMSPPLDGQSSPPRSFGSPRFREWGNVPRTAGRPRPRPENILIVGFDVGNKISGRVLGESDEAKEGNESAPFRFESDADAGRPSSEVSRHTWRDDRVELEMERNALKEDVELWRKRCRGLEERLEAERKDGAMLRERMRKLGDRLSSLSASDPHERYPSTSSSGPEDSRLIAQLREQLFTLMTSLESERREKENALARLSQSRSSSAIFSFEADPAGSSQAPLSPRPSNHAHVRESQSSVIPSIPASSVTPATPLPDTDDPNISRMKAWGFPRATPTSPKLSAKRHSFFGLSSIPRRDAVEDVHTGLDLPPFVVTKTSVVKRAVSQSAPTGPKDVPALLSTNMTSSASSATNSALSFISSYLPLSITSPVSRRPGLPRSPSESASSMHSSMSSIARHLAEPVAIGQLDFRAGCKSCIGDVIEF